MNNKPDPRLSFDPEQAALNAGSVQRSWLPLPPTPDFSIARRYWLTRGSRGISWHRCGLARLGLVS